VSEAREEALRQESREQDFSIAVSGSSLTAGRDLIVAARSDSNVLSKLRGLDYRRILGGSAGIALVVFLVAYLWPSSPAVPVDLDLQASYLRFRLAEVQPVLEPMSVQSLSVLDLQEFRFPEERVRKEPDTRRLDLRLEGLESAERPGILTLQHGFLPAGAVVEMKVGEDEGFSFSIDSLEEPFSVSAVGDFQYRSLIAGRRASPWSRISASTAQLLEVEPRSRSLNLVFDFGGREGEEIAPSIRVDRLWLYEVSRITDGEHSRLEEIYHIRSGTFRVGSAENSIDLGHGSELRVGGASGRISALRWNGKTLQFRFQGVATSLSRGPREEAVELVSRRSLARSTIADVAAGLTVLNGFLSLILSFPTFLRLLRVRLLARREASKLEL